jgi:hypothetical protein
MPFFIDKPEDIGTVWKENNRLNLKLNVSEKIIFLSEAFQKTMNPFSKKPNTKPQNQVLRWAFNPSKLF